MQFGRWLLRPNRCVKVSERINQFVGFADDSDKGSTFAKGLHGGDTDGLHGVSGKGHTCPQSVERGEGAHVVLVRTACSIPFEREKQVERFAAFQHPNRLALASFLYEPSPWGCAQRCEFFVW